MCMQTVQDNIMVTLMINKTKYATKALDGRPLTSIACDATFFHVLQTCATLEQRKCKRSTTYTCITYSNATLNSIYDVMSVNYRKETQKQLTKLFSKTDRKKTKGQN